LKKIQQFEKGTVFLSRQGASLIQQLWPLTETVYHIVDKGAAVQLSHILHWKWLTQQSIQRLRSKVDCLKTSVADPDLLYDPVHFFTSGSGILTY
jgi:hypothetical protein